MSKNIIYVVSVINISKKTEEDYKKELEKMKFNYPVWQDKTVAYYKTFFKEIYNAFEYNIQSEVVGYFSSREVAEKNVENNVFDINDGGSYPYAIVQPVALGTFYPETCKIPETPKYFKYFSGLHKFVEIPKLESIEDTKTREALKGMKEYFEQ